MTSCGRRDFLAQSLRAVTGLGCLVMLPGAGCANREEAAATLVVPLAELPEGVRVRRELGGTPVEIVRRGGTVTARSLLCTHQGCEVAWHEDENAYFCPCHDGRFDAYGQPTYGPPRLPLREFTVTAGTDEVAVGD